MIQRHVIEKDAGIKWITAKYFNMLATPKFSYNRSVKKPAYVVRNVCVCVCVCVCLRTQILVQLIG